MKLKHVMKPARDDYLELVKRFPLRVIGNERELDAATKVGLQVAAKGEAALSEGQTQFLDVLDRLLEDYEDAFHGMPVGDTTPLERLRSVAAEAGWSASDLGRLLGNRSLGSLLLTGRRELSKTHVRLLAEHFKVDAGYFL